MAKKRKGKGKRFAHPSYWLILDAHGVLIPSSERLILRGLARHSTLPYWYILLRWAYFHIPSQLGKMDSKTYYEKVIGRPLSEQAFNEWIVKPYREKFIIFPQVLQELKRLHSKGWKIGVLSNMHELQARLHREQKTFKDFDLVLLSCELGQMKPFPETMELMQKHTRARRDHIVFVDDVWLNVVPAQLMGYNAIRLRGYDPLLRFLMDLE
ncbi:MAG: HAD hydrolase-like protein [Candidatus Diapherotrites archaeon]|nr:HAD hydrolase-like protein [Candidatus Diapherotrites archaeon]MDZ4256663.1 HAD hydrolase-like protein [archaeon]